MEEQRQRQEEEARRAAAASAAEAGVPTPSADGNRRVGKKLLRLTTWIKVCLHLTRIIFLVSQNRRRRC